VSTVRAYLRVSTNDQATNGHGLDAQRARINAESIQRDWPEFCWYVDGGESGKDLDRPEMQRLLADMRRGDVLVVSKLDRLSRSLADFAMLLELAQKRGWTLVALDLGLDLSSPTGRLVAGVMASVAAWEREAIGQRTADGLAAAKVKGKLPGRRSRVPRQVQVRLLELRDSGMMLQEIADTLNAEGHLTVTGQPWACGSVHSSHRSARLEADARSVTLAEVLR
jgi:DNA invertase Pin-like site-specific DNA recombinase